MLSLLAKRMLVNAILTLALAIGSTSYGIDVGSIAANFTLPNPRVTGEEVSLWNETNKGLVVLAFLGAHSPMSKRYAPRLEELAQTYKDRGVQFLGISSSHQDSVTDVVRFARDYGVTFPILKDEASRVANEFGAERTPEVFLIDKDHRVRYRGRIDDQFEYEFERAVPTRLDLVVALEEVLSGQNVRMSRTPAVGCRIGRVLAPKSEATVFWHPEISEIFQRHCTECHRPNGSAPFPLTRYEDVEGWGETIREAIAEKRMPPWFAKGHIPPFANQNTLSKSDTDRILKWIDEGCPQGDSSKDDSLPYIGTKWRLPREPQQQFAISESDVEIAPQGRQDPQYFLVNTNLEKTLLVSALELRPSNKSVVRQASVFVVPPGLAKVYPSIRELVTAPELLPNLICWYSPDCQATVYPNDVAREIPAGSKLLFKILYRPTGRVERDRTSLGVLFADSEKATRRAKTLSLSLSNIALSSAHPTYTATKQLSIDGNFQLLSVIPNLTIRGKNARLSLHPPQGPDDVLVDVTHFAYYWQYEYRYVDPLPLKLGSTVKCSAEFGESPAVNSEEIINPLEEEGESPAVPDETTSNDEMIAFLEVVTIPPVTVAGQLKPSINPMENISQAIGGIAATILVCLAILWLKPASRPADQPAPPPTAS